MSNKKRLLFGLILSMISLPTIGQVSTVTISGVLKDKQSEKALPFVNVILKAEKDSIFVSGTVSSEDGHFTLSSVAPGSYILEISFIGYRQIKQPLLVGKLSSYLDLGTIELEVVTTELNEVVVTGSQDVVVETLDKKTFKMSDNINQSGGSLLQVMQNLPGVTLSEEGTVRLRGNDKVIVLIDGKQTALTGFGSQRGLDNIPASAIEKIEIINNPSAKYDANGNAGIINIVYKKEVNEGLNGQAGLAFGLGALWVKKENYPGIGAQYESTPKLNPPVSLNYRKKKMNLFLQADDLYTETLNKNEFVDRYYSNGDTIRQQTRRNRDTNFLTIKSGIDYLPIRLR